MDVHTTFMQRALRSARLGAGLVAPNPMVGAILVQGDRVLAEGWHKAYGGPHAEVECLQAFGEGPVPQDAVLYVTLEPCSHHGKTPPCADLLIARGVPEIVIAHADPFPKVAGAGIERSRGAGIRVTVGVAEEEARWTNRRYITSIERGRPYVILKWARSSDGFLDRHPRGERGVQRIGSQASDVLVHRWRSEEQAILVGSRTVLHDDPQLTVRHVSGRSPLRVVIDREGISPDVSHIYDGRVPTLLFTSVPRSNVRVDQHQLDAFDDPLDVLLKELDGRGIRSILVEGGGRLLQAFLERGLWDEARIITGVPVFGNGTPAPVIASEPLRSYTSGPDRIDMHLNSSMSQSVNSPLPEWPW